MLSPELSCPWEPTLPPFSGIPQSASCPWCRTFEELYPEPWCHWEPVFAFFCWNIAFRSQFISLGFGSWFALILGLCFVVFWFSLFLLFGVFGEWTSYKSALDHYPALMKPWWAFLQKSAQNPYVSCDTYLLQPVWSLAQRSSLKGGASRWPCTGSRQWTDRRQHYPAVKTLGPRYDNIAVLQSRTVMAWYSQC